MGRAEEGISHLEQAIRLSPSDPNAGIFYSRLAAANLYLKRHQAAVEWARKAPQKTKSWVYHIYLPAALSYLGRDAEARRAREDLEKLQPGVNIETVRESALTADESYLQHLLSGLRKAGLLE